MALESSSAGGPERKTPWAFPDSSSALLVVEKDA